MIAKRILTSIQKHRLCVANVHGLFVVTNFDLLIVSEAADDEHSGENCGDSTASPDIAPQAWNVASL